MTTITWTCPLCNYKNHFRWPDSDKPVVDDDAWLCCRQCKKESHMTYRFDGEWLWDGDWRQANDR